MDHQNGTELLKMDISEIRIYLKEIDLQQLRYIYVHKRNFFFFDKYYINIATKNGNLISIPFLRKHKEAVKKEIFTIKTLLNFSDTSK
jgi:predicted nucleic acid-binding protein